MRPREIGGEAYNANLVRDLEMLTSQLKKQSKDPSDIKLTSYTNPQATLAEINQFLVVLKAYAEEIDTQLASKFDLTAQTSKKCISKFIHDAEVFQTHFQEELGLVGVTDESN